MSENNELRSATKELLDVIDAFIYQEIEMAARIGNILDAVKKRPVDARQARAVVHMQQQLSGLKENILCLEKKARTLSAAFPDHDG